MPSRSSSTRSTGSPTGYGSDEPRRIPATPGGGLIALHLQRSAVAGFVQGRRRAVVLPDGVLGWEGGAETGGRRVLVLGYLRRW